MIIKNLIDEDFIQYEKSSMFIVTSQCSFKCDKECGKPVCQNSELAKAPSITVEDKEIVDRYLNNPITEAITIGGLEPFDQFVELYNFISEFRARSNDDIVIYTGYYPNEISSYLNKLSIFNNIIIKFGRFIPNSTPIYDELLGVNLASCNQKAMRLEDSINENNSCG